LSEQDTRYRTSWSTIHHSRHIQSSKSSHPISTRPCPSEQAPHLQAIATKHCPSPQTVGTLHPPTLAHHAYHQAAHRTISSTALLHRPPTWTITRQTGTALARMARPASVQTSHRHRYLPATIAILTLTQPDSELPSMLLDHCIPAVISPSKRAVVWLA
jgi:hypothetical protein